MLQFCNIYNIVSKYSNFLSYGFVISKWMILSTLYVYELIYTTWSLCSFCKSKLLLETLVFRQINMKFLKNYLSIMSLSDIMILVTLLEASAVYIAALNFDLLRSACWHLAKSETAHPVFCTVGVKKIWICNK